MDLFLFQKWWIILQPAEKKTTDFYHRFKCYTPSGRLGSFVCTSLMGTISPAPFGRHHTTVFKRFGSSCSSCRSAETTRPPPSTCCSSQRGKALWTNLTSFTSEEMSQDQTGSRMTVGTVHAGRRQHSDALISGPNLDIMYSLFINCLVSSGSGLIVVWLQDLSEKNKSHWVKNWGCDILSQSEAEKLLHAFGA